MRRTSFLILTLKTRFPTSIIFVEALVKKVPDNAKKKEEKKTQLKS